MKVIGRGVLMVYGSREKLKVIAVSSIGGHRSQLLRLSSFLDQFDCKYVCAGNAAIVDREVDFILNDVNRESRLSIIKCILLSVKILLKVKPKLVVSTGALPGLIFIILSKYLFRAKVIWVDSIANGSELSGSGRVAKGIADLTITQWEDLADDNVRFLGRVI